MKTPLLQQKNKIRQPFGDASYDYKNTVNNNIVPIYTMRSTVQLEKFLLHLMILRTNG
jgi:hypothetical protein